MQMPYTSECHVVLGYLLEEQHLFEVVERNHHEKCRNVGPGPYCSFCGHPMELTSRQRTARSEYNQTNNTLCDIPILNVFVGEEAWDTKQRRVWTFAEIRLEGGVEHRRTALKKVSFGTEVEVANYERTCRNFLEPLKLWDPERWGVWVSFSFG